jgi:hypothetical protein
MMGETVMLVVCLYCTIFVLMLWCLPLKKN